MSAIVLVDQMSYEIPYSRKILENVSLELHAGEFIGILGHNGTGKTTLIDLLLGLKSPLSGSIQVLGEDPYKIDRKFKEKTVFLSQDVSIKGNLSISEFLKFHSQFYSDYSTEDEAALLEVFELNRDQKIGSLSTGQQKKVQVVAGLATRPKLIIIDEITAVMDPETRDKFFSEIQKVQKLHGTSIILATNLAEDLVDRASKVLFIEAQRATIHEPHEISELFNLSEKAA